MKANELADLLQIGLTEGEAKAYAALLELGPSSVGPITKRTGISYSNIYEILERLIKKGIVSIIMKNSVKNFQAVTPSNLSNYLDQKQTELDNQRELLEKALPRIESLQSSFPKQEATMFLGTKGLRAAYAEFFKDATPDDENLWIYVHDDEYAEMSDRFYLQYWFDLASDVKKVRGIADSSYKKSKFISKFKKKHGMRFVKFPVFSHGEVFRDKFLLVSWEDPVISVLVHAKHVSENFRKYFEAVWKEGKA